MTESIILKFTLPCFIADRAIERMINEKKLHDVFSSLQRFFILRMYDHAVSYCCSTSNRKFRNFFYVDQAHAAIPCNVQCWMPAKMRNLNVVLQSNLNDSLPLLRFEF